MADRYLLDTDILSQLIRDPGSLRKKIADVGEASLCTSIIVACELRFGARKKGTDPLLRRVEQLLTALAVLPLDAGVDGVYADVRFRLESRGQPIGGNDCLIAAHAIHTGCVLVTGNQREFRRVPKLRTEDWTGRGRH